MEKFYLRFEPVKLQDKNPYLDRLSECPETTSDYSFINLFGWAEAYGLDLAAGPDLIWIRQNRPEKAYWAPVGNWEKADWEKQLFNEEMLPARFIRVPEKLKTIWQENFPNRVTVHESRGDWDYLYLIQDLIDLKGNRYHKKKNLLNQFRKKYDFHYASLTPELISHVLDMQDDWCEWRDCEAVDTLVSENQSIGRICENWKEWSNLTGGALFVHDTMVAYTVAEHYENNMILIHFEKGKPEFKGIYQAINQMFLADIEDQGWNLVNREQDMDDEGLRKAKLSYHPVDFLRKYIIEIA